MEKPEVSTHMSTRQSKVKETTKADTIQAIEQAMMQQERGRKLKQVYTLKDLVETPDSYMVVKPKTMRTIITLTNFAGERLKIRITQPVGGRFIQIVNINYDRLQDVIGMLQVIRQKLDENGADKKFIKPQPEQIL
jgi:hypothetical protein